jgi:hypothetical protein
MNSPHHYLAMTPLSFFLLLERQSTPSGPVFSPGFRDDRVARYSYPGVALENQDHVASFCHCRQRLLLD